jgi:hypothetical protein
VTLLQRTVMNSQRRLVSSISICMDDFRPLWLFFINPVRWSELDIIMTRQHQQTHHFEVKDVKWVHDEVWFNNMM